LTAIEFRPDGTLIGAGAALYTVDALTGATVEVGTTGIAPIVDLDVAPNGRILGISYPADAPSQLLDLSPGLTPYPPRTLLPEGKSVERAIVTDPVNPRDQLFVMPMMISATAMNAIAKNTNVRPNRAFTSRVTK
jgi:hypothetical protein